MKVLKVLKKLILVLMFLTTVVVGSKCYGYDVNRGRYYCPTCLSIYTEAGSHRDCQSKVAQPVAQNLYCTKCNTWYTSAGHTCPVRPALSTKRDTVLGSGVSYRGESRYTSPIIDIDIVTVQQPLRYSIIRQYPYWYGGYSRSYYNLSGRNYFRSWLFGGDRHRHHRNYHRSYRGNIYSYNTW